MTPPPPIAQLELVLRQLVQEHKGLLVALEAHEAAIRSCDLDRIERAAREHDLVRQKLAATEARRRQVSHHLNRQHRSLKTLTIPAIGDLYPDKRDALLGLRAELVEAIAKAQQKSALIGRVAHAVQGHVGATLRLVANAASGPSTYTSRGETAMPMRIGRLNAVA